MTKLKDISLKNLRKELKYHEDYTRVLSFLIYLKEGETPPK